MKLTDLLGTMGGLIKALLIAGYFFAHPVAKLSLKTALINRLFKFEDPNIDSQDNVGEEDCDDEYQEDDKEDEKADNVAKERISLSNCKYSLHNSTKENLCPPRNTNQKQTFFSTLKKDSNVFNSSRDSTNISLVNLNHMTTFLQPSRQFHHDSMIQLNKKQSSFDPFKNIIRESDLPNLSMGELDEEKNRHKSNEFASNKKEISERRSSHCQISKSKDKELDPSHSEKVKLVRTMLKSYVSNHTTNEQDIMKASTIVGIKKKDNPDRVFRRLFKSSTESLTMKLWDYLKYFLRLKQQVKNKQIEFSMERVNERLDIVFIMKKLIEVDKLKMLFLNEDQRKVFEYLPKPIVKINPEEQFLEQQKKCEDENLNHAWAKQMMNYKQNFIGKASEAMTAYQNIMEKKGNNLDQLDQKLIDMLDESKKEIFQAESPQLKKRKKSALSVIESMTQFHPIKVPQYRQELDCVIPQENSNFDKEMSDFDENKISQIHCNEIIFNKRNALHFEKHATLPIQPMCLKQDNVNLRPTSNFQANENTQISNCHSLKPNNHRQCENLLPQPYLLSYSKMKKDSHKIEISKVESNQVSNQEENSIISDQLDHLPRSQSQAYCCISSVASYNRKTGPISPNQQSRESLSKLGIQQNKSFSKIVILNCVEDNNNNKRSDEESHQKLQNKNSLEKVNESHLSEFSSANAKNNNKREKQKRAISLNFEENKKQL